MHLKNLIMLAFSNEQVEVPYNATMRKEMARIEEIRREASNLKLLLYQTLRRDIMAYTVPYSLILEKVTLVMPEAITAIESAIKTLSKISTYLSSEGISAMKRADIFPMLNKETLSLLVINQMPLSRKKLSLDVQILTGTKLSHLVVRQCKQENFALEV